ncbi:MAG: DUF3007 family protein [Synechococcales cyanobacterium RU_4_20]|nr:DUF3007 family protein [Synechococcales cyanobacterium RU_4_20]
MRRLDVLWIGLGLLGGGALVYGVFVGIGLDSLDAGVWSQVILIGVVLAWTSTYLYRAVTQKMTYHQQLQAYEDAMLQKRLESMSSEEIAALQAEVEAERTQQAQAGPESDKMGSA